MNVMVYNNVPILTNSLSYDRTPQFLILFKVVIYIQF